MIREKLTHTPRKPGSYQMKDASGRVIYVGKAKDLKSRLMSYFTGSHDYKTQKMVSQVDDFDYIVTNSEIEALILELDLIKQYQPRYNVLLTDDKSYPYIELTREKHPKLIVTRRVRNKRRQRLFGPYPNVRAARETLRILNRLYPLRKCHTLPDEPCLYYHLGQCLAPCIKDVPQTEYRRIEKEVKSFLRGNTRGVIENLEAKMHQASENLEFERAQEYKETIDAIRATTEERQAVHFNDPTPRDVVGVADQEGILALSIIFVRNGKVHATDKKIMRHHADADTALRDFIGQFYRTYPVPREVLTNRPAAIEELARAIGFRVRRPQRGDKRKLMEMAVTNAAETLRNEKSRAEEQEERTYGVLESLAELLEIDIPYHIEAFDNAHLHGSHPVSSLVVFRNARPSKHEYRKFKLDQPEGRISDVDQMREVIYRRYRRVILEDLPRPDLILVDGGIQQMNAAREVLNSLELDLPLAGIVKSEDHKTHHLLDENHGTLELDRHGRLFNFLSSIQEEAHRFAVSFHRDRREKGVFESALDGIPGVGQKTKQKLLNQYRTAKRVAEASDQELRQLGIPKKTVDNLKSHLEDRLKR